MENQWPKRIELTPAEVSFALCIATQRDASKKNRESRLSSLHTGFGVHFAGLVGEVCFRKVFGGKVNQIIKPEGDKHEADILISDGRKIEVKTSLFSGDNVELKIEGDSELNASEFFWSSSSYFTRYRICFPNCFF